MGWFSGLDPRNWDDTIPGEWIKKNSGKIKNTALDIATLGQTYGARQAKRGYRDAAAGSRQLGDDQASYFQNLGNRQRQAGQNIVRNSYGTARQAYGQYQQNRPTQVNSAYREIMNRQSADPYGREPGHFSRLAAGNRPITNYRDWHSQHGEDINSDDARAVEIRNRQRQSQVAPSYMRDIVTRYNSGNDGYTTRIAERQAGINPLTNYAGRREQEARQAIDMPEMGNLANLKLTTELAQYRAEQLANEDAYAQKYFKDLDGAIKSKGAAEKFYDEQLAGVNSANDYFARKMEEDLNRRAAATGGFASGLAQKQYGEQLQGLRAQQMMQMGDLARSAQEMQLARQGQGGELALGADSSQMARQGHYLDASKSFDELNISKLDKAMQGRLGMESIRTQRMGQADDVFSRMADYEAQREQALDALYGSREGERFRAADSAGNFYLQDEAAKDRVAGEASSSAQNRYVRGGEAAERGSFEGNRDRESNIQITQGMATEDKDKATFRQGQNRDLLAAATGASAEDRDYFKNLIDAGISIGDKEAGILRDFEQMAVNLDTEAGRQKFQAELAALEAELLESGVDAKTIQSIITYYQQNISLGMSGMTGKPPGGR